MLPKKYMRADDEEEYRASVSRKGRRRRQNSAEVFKCRHCRRFIGPLPCGGHHRNHCPFCLYSRHVDERSGDRLSSCGSRMQPIGSFQRPNGEHVLVHRCLGCDFERFNRIAADDDFDLVLALPVLPPRTKDTMKGASCYVGTQLIASEAIYCLSDGENMMRQDMQNGTMDRQ